MQTHISKAWVVGGVVVGLLCVLTATCMHAQTQKAFGGGDAAMGVLHLLSFERVPELVLRQRDHSSDAKRHTPT